MIKNNITSFLIILSTFASFCILNARNPGFNHPREIYASYKDTIKVIEGTDIPGTFLILDKNYQPLATPNMYDIIGLDYVNDSTSYYKLGEFSFCGETTILVMPNIDTLIIHNIDPRHRFDLDIKETYTEDNKVLEMKILVDTEASTYIGRSASFVGKNIEKEMAVFVEKPGYFTLQRSGFTFNDSLTSQKPEDLYYKFSVAAGYGCYMKIDTLIRPYTHLTKTAPKIETINISYLGDSTDSDSYITDFKISYPDSLKSTVKGYVFEITADSNLFHVYETNDIYQNVNTDSEVFDNYDISKGVCKVKKLNTTFPDKVSIGSLMASQCILKYWVRISLINNNNERSTFSNIYEYHPPVKYEFDRPPYNLDTQISSFSNDTITKYIKAVSIRSDFQLKGTPLASFIDFQTRNFRFETKIDGLLDKEVSIEEFMNMKTHIITSTTIDPNDKCNILNDTIYIKNQPLVVFMNYKIKGQGLELSFQKNDPNDYGVIGINFGDGSTPLFDTLINNHNIFYTYADTGTYTVYVNYSSLKYKNQGKVFLSDSTIKDIELRDVATGVINLKINEKYTDCGIAYSASENVDGTFNFEAIKPINDLENNIVWTFPDGKTTGTIVKRTLPNYGWNIVSVQYNKSDSCNPIYRSSVYYPDRRPCPNKITYTQTDNKFAFQSTIEKQNTFGTYTWHANNKTSLLGSSQELNIAVPASTQNQYIYCHFREQNNDCESWDSVKISVDSEIYKSYSIKGKIKNVYHYDLNDFSIILRDAHIVSLNTGSAIMYKAKPDSLGNFEFNNLVEGSKYYLYSTSYQTNYSNTYYPSTSDFTKAKPIEVNNNMFIDMEILPLVLPKGPDGNIWNSGSGFIRGVVSYTVSNSSQRLTQNSNQKPLQGVIVELYDINGYLLTRTLTDEYGFYQFDKLLDGNYIIKTYAIGSAETQENKITTSSSLVPFLVTNHELKAQTNVITVVESNTEINNGFSLFPNPVAHKLYINVPNAKDQYNFMIFNSLGKNEMNGKLENQIDIEKLNAGIYSIILQNGNKKSILKFVKE